ncbi:MAG: DUF4832 domain-containing protein [Clostridiaceae bacterium]|nr:DUF4832 domain-containing protein [Clostridiaceae bacterium]
MYYYQKNYITATLKQTEQTEIADDLNMPECGWYQLYSYYLQPDIPLTPYDLYLEETDSNSRSYRLSLLEFNIASYADRKLDRTAKENIRQVLDLFSGTQSKVIIRFLYDWDGAGRETEPDSIETVKLHMKQAGKLLSDYKDIIYTTQGIFVGSWAEMHTSKFLSNEEMTELTLYYASVTDPDIYLAVRTPDQYQTIIRQLETYPEKYSAIDISLEEIKARLGLFNDGMLGSVSDVGTYHDADTAQSEEEAQAIREEAISFQNLLCLNVPNGGEVVNSSSYNDTWHAISDLSAMHVSYLNQMYDEEVITKWKNSTYENTASVFHGLSTYDYITRHLGARFVLRSCELSWKPFQNGNATGSILIENVGFSNLYHDKQMTLTLVSKKTNRKVTLLDSQTDSSLSPCSWDAGTKTSISFSFSPFDLEDGEYQLLIQLSDPVTKESIPFANDSLSEEQDGYLLGEITIAR